MTKTILLDMDDVLVDFIGGAAAIHGHTRESLYKVWPKGNWDMCPALGLTIDQWWEPIHREGALWWSCLDPLPWMWELIDVATKEVGPEGWYVVSAPSPCETSHQGKVRWLQKQFGAGFDRFCLTQHKHLFSKPGVVLVDDREKNCRRFTKAGGQGLLFPARNNTLHAQADNPMATIRRFFGRSYPCT